MTDANTAFSEIIKGIAVDKTGVLNIGESGNDALKEKAAKLLQGAKSILVLAMEIFPETITKATSKALVGEITMRDLYLANSDVTDGILSWEGYKLVKKLHANGFKGLLLPSKDSPYDARFLKGPLSYKKPGRSRRNGRNRLEQPAADAGIRRQGKAGCRYLPMPHSPLPHRQIWKTPA